MIEKTKECLHCHEIKSITEFYKCKTNKDGLKTICKFCSKKKNREYNASISKKNPSFWKDRMARYRKLFPEKNKNIYLKYNYGIELEEYNKLFELQKGSCLICGIHQSELDRPLCVDHNHDTNKVRGLLCNSCNSILGYACDNINILNNAIEYLKQE